MTYNEEAYQNYRTNFPSSEFLQKYFGQDQSSELLFDGRATRVTLYTQLRRLFGEVLVDSPKLWLDLQNSANTGFTPIYVFTDGVPEPWVDDQLERQGLMLELSADAFRELGEEFMTHFRNGAFTGSNWWCWKCEGNSIWVEVIPEAIAAGKHIEPPRSLMEVLYGSDQAE
jgi:hypothetical protein